MRVLFTIFPATAHLYPVVPLAWALHNEGHEVRVAAHPSMSDAIARCGLTAIPFGDHEAIRHVVEFNDKPEKLQTLITGLALRCEANEPWHDQWLATIATLTTYVQVLDELVEVCRDWQPDLVLWDPFCVPAAIAATVVGAAHARILWGQDNIGWLYERFAARDRETRPVAVDGALNWLMQPMLERYGLEFKPEMLVGQWTIEPRPIRWSVAADLDYLPVRPVPYNGSGHVEDWVRERPRRPRVVLSLGVGGRGRQLFDACGSSPSDILGKLATLDIDLVVTLPGSAFTDTLPDNVRIVDYVPLNQVLPTCSAIIHHGGDGTALAAGAFEVPQLVTPVPFWAEESVAGHIADQGSGLVVRPDELTADVLTAALARLLNEPQFAESSAAFHEEIRSQSSPYEVIPALEERVARYR